MWVASRPQSLYFRVFISPVTNQTNQNNKKTHTKPKKTTQPNKKQVAGLVWIHIIVKWLCSEGKNQLAVVKYIDLSCYFAGHYQSQLQYYSLFVMWSLLYFTEFIINSVCPRVKVVRRGFSPSDLTEDSLSPKWSFNCYPWLQPCYMTGFHYVLVCKTIRQHVNSHLQWIYWMSQHRTHCVLVKDSLT